MNEETNVRQAYIERWPSDELGQEINKTLSFYDLFEALGNYKDIYETIGVGDSVVRERCFKILAEVMDCDYDYIYDQWLLST